MWAGLWRSNDPEEQVIYLPPWFCLASLLLSEVKGHVKDEAELSIRHPADPSWHHKSYTITVDAALHPVRLISITATYRAFHSVAPRSGDLRANFDFTLM